MRSSTTSTVGAVLRLGEAVAAATQRAHLGADGLVLLAAGEVGGAELVEQLAVELDRRAVALAACGLVRLLRTRALLLHQRVEPSTVDGAAALLGDLAREVDREAERVVQEERVVAGDVALVEDAVEQVEAARERLAEPLLLASHDAAHEVVLLHELGVRARPSRRRSRRPAPA